MNYDSLIEKIKERCDLSEKDPWVYLDDVEEIIRQHQLNEASAEILSNLPTKPDRA